MKLLKPLHEGVALPGSIAVGPVRVEAACVPLLDTFEISRKRCLADRYRSRSWGDKPFETGEEDIHATLPPKRFFFRRPASAQYQPHSRTRYRSAACSESDSPICSGLSRSLL